jgi:hypothetical protein
VALLLLKLIFLRASDSNQQRLDKRLDFFTLQCTGVISVDSVKDGFIDLGKLLLVSEDGM